LFRDPIRYKVHPGGGKIPDPMPAPPILDREWLLDPRYKIAEQLCIEEFDKVKLLLKSVLLASVDESLHHHLRQADGLEGLGNLRLLMPVQAFAYIKAFENKLDALHVLAHDSPNILFSEAEKIYTTLGTIDVTSLDPNAKKLLLDILNFDNHAYRWCHVWTAHAQRWKFLVTEEPSPNFARLTKIRTRTAFAAIVLKDYDNHFRQADEDFVRQRPRRPVHEQTSLTASVVCKNCNMQGHLEKDCRQKGGKKQQYCKICQKYGHGGKSNPCTAKPSDAALPAKPTATALPVTTDKYCTNCKMTNHNIDRCFKLHPDLAKSVSFVPDTKKNNNVNSKTYHPSKIRKD